MGKNSNITGIGYILGGIGCLAGMDAVAKVLVGADYSVIQILAVRGWIIALALILFLPRLGGLMALRTDQPYKHGLRMAVGFTSPFLFFTALKDLGLADVTVIFFGGATFLMTALSALWFKESVGPHRWGAITLGFIGVLIAASPTGGVFQAEALYAFASGATYALMVLMTRWLGPNEGTFRPVFYYNVGMAVAATAALPLAFTPMPPVDSATVALMAVLAIGGHFGVTRAFQTASVSLLAPFEYTALLWAALLGYLFWSEVPTANVLVGAAVIFVSGLYLLRREALAVTRSDLAAPLNPLLPDEAGSEEEAVRDPLKP